MHPRILRGVIQVKAQQGKIATIICKEQIVWVETSININRVRIPRVFKRGSLTFPQASADLSR